MIAAALIGVLGVGSSLYFGNQKLTEKAAEVSELRTDRDLARITAEALREAQTGKQTALDSQELLDTLLPQKKNQETLIADVLYTATAEAGIPINSVSSLAFTLSSENPTDQSGTEKFKAVPGVSSYPFNIVVNDISYETLLTLLEEIESNGRLVQIDVLQISPDAQRPGFIGSVTLNLKAFLKP